MDPNAGKKGLINKYSREELQQRLEAETFTRKTVSFYRYVHINDPYALRDSLFTEWFELNAFGRVYLAKEGVNAQMSVPEPHWKTFIAQLNAKPEFKDIPLKVAVEDDGKSFLKLTVKVRAKILADGQSDNSYDVTNVGQHLSAAQWNNAIDQGATVVDIRNHYESEIGHFENALLPQSETFREELPEVLDLLKGKEDNKILLYCTGGIRCEKTSAFLKHHGFKDVNQLHGGIIDYARQIKTQDLPNRFKGKNFVFDERLGETVGNNVISHCHQCGEPCDTHVNCANLDCNLLFIQCPTCAVKNENCCSSACIDFIHLPAEVQEELRKGHQSKKGFYSHRKVGALKTKS
jgi:UPF0176 protein